MEVCSVEDIRRTIGVGTDVIEDDDVTRIIDESVDIVSSYLNSSITPKTIIEALDHNLGEDSEIIKVGKMPILNLKTIKIDGTSISPKYIKIYKGAKLVLTDDAEETVWDNDELQSNVIKYIYGLIEDTNTSTTTSAAIETPTDNDILALTSVDGFKAEQWVKIQGMDGYTEYSEVESVDSSAKTITLDLSYPHESGSTVTIQRVPNKIKRIVEIVASLMIVARIVGSSYTDIVGYGLDEFNVQKGEPYTQWRETYNQLNSEKKELLKRIRPMAVVL